MTLAASILALTVLTGSTAFAAVTDKGAAGAELIGTKAPSWEGVDVKDPLEQRGPGESMHCVPLLDALRAAR